MGIFTIDPETYRRYKDDVLKLSNSFQEIGRRGLSDREIAERLGLDERTVTEVRCVAEREVYPLDEWQAAIDLKGRAAKEWLALTLKRSDLKETSGRKRRSAVRRFGRLAVHGADSAADPTGGKRQVSAGAGG